MRGLSRRPPCRVATGLEPPGCLSARLIARIETEAA